MSAVTVERPKQLRSTHPSPLHPLPLFPPPSLPNIKGSLWHGLGCIGRLAGAAALRAIHSLILYERPAVRLESHQLCSFIFVSSSCIWHPAPWHTPARLCSVSLRALPDRGVLYQVIAGCAGWRTWNVTSELPLISTKEGFWANDSGTRRVQQPCTVSLTD